MLCPWCDKVVLAEGQKLCATCGEGYRYPPTVCTVNPRHIPTLADACAECTLEREAAERRAARNAPLIEQLQAIRLAHGREINKPWPGAEFGKTLVGGMLDEALRDLGGDPAPIPQLAGAYAFYDRGRRK